MGDRCRLPFVPCKRLELAFAYHPEVQCDENKRNNEVKNESADEERPENEPYDRCSFEEIMRYQGSCMLGLLLLGDRNSISHSIRGKC